MDEYNWKGFRITIEKASRSSDFKAFLIKNISYFKRIGESKRILLKINIPFWETPPGSCTRKETLFQTIQFLKEIFDLPIYIVESRYGFVPIKVFKEYGDPDVEVIDLFERPHISVWGKSVSGKRPLNLYVSKDVMTSSNFIITLGPPKTHEYVIYTGAVKTMMGFLRMKKRHMHGLTSVRDFPKMEKMEAQIKCLHENLHLLSGLVSTDVAILDGTLCMEGNGPVFGDPVNWDFWAISNDPPMLDFATSFLMGLEPLDIAYLWMLARDKKELVEFRKFLLDDPFRFFKEYGLHFKPHRNMDELLRISRGLIESLKRKGGEATGSPLTGGEELC